MLRQRGAPSSAILDLPKKAAVKSVDNLEWWSCFCKHLIWGGVTLRGGSVTLLSDMKMRERVMLAGRLCYDHTHHGLTVLRRALRTKLYRGNAGHLLDSLDEVCQRLGEAYPERQSTVVQAGELIRHMAFRYSVEVLKMVAVWGQVNLGKER